MSRATFVHARYGSVQCSGSSASSFSNRKEKEKRYKGQQESSVVVATALFVIPARINVPCFRSSAVILPPLQQWIPRLMIARSIPARDRSAVYVRGELRQSPSTAHHNFHLARSISPLKNHLLFANHSLQLSLLLLLSPLLPLPLFLLLLL